MPSPHSSDETQADARAIAANLGVELIEIPIEPAMDGLRASCSTDSPAGETTGATRDLAAENLQARIRGNLVMALSNRFGWLVLTTGNKSEMSVGYATLYGDMAGGFAVIKDVPKTLVYDLVRHRNRPGRGPRPGPRLGARARAVGRAAPGPARRGLAAALRGPRPHPRGLRRARPGAASRSPPTGIPADVVEDVLRMVDRAEYKRRQAPPGIKITPKAFGRDRRLPITNRFRG